MTRETLAVLLPLIDPLVKIAVLALLGWLAKLQAAHIKSRTVQTVLDELERKIAAAFAAAYQEALGAIESAGAAPPDVPPRIPAAQVIRRVRASSPYLVRALAATGEDVDATLAHMVAVHAGASHHHEVADLMRSVIGPFIEGMKAADSVPTAPAAAAPDRTAS